jgi:hypothetical protein
VKGVAVVSRTVDLAGAAHLVLADRGVVRHLDPAEAMFAAMLTGWDRQQASRLLATSTRKQRTDAVRRFARFARFVPVAVDAG